MDHSFTNGHLTVRILNAETNQPMYGLTLGDKNYVVAEDGDEYLIETTVTGEYTNVTEVDIDGKFASSSCQRQTTPVKHEGFRECDSAGNLMGYRNFKVSVPEICEPGSAQANVNVERNGTEEKKVGAICVKAHTAVISDQVYQDRVSAEIVVLFVLFPSHYCDLFLFCSRPCQLLRNATLKRRQ
jgi:hypothetical protein